MAQARPKSTSETAPDAIALLMDDHKKVKAMFKAFETLKKHDGDGKEKSVLVGRICNELKIHTQVEEEIFYPAVRAAGLDHDLMDEADVEHAGAKELIAQLEGMKPGDDHYDAKVTVLGESIDHHVKEEHEEMFPKAKTTALDMKALGSQLQARKSELLDLHA